MIASLLKLFQNIKSRFKDKIKQIRLKKHIINTLNNFYFK